MGTKYLYKHIRHNYYFMWVPSIYPEPFRKTSFSARRTISTGCLNKHFELNDKFYIVFVPLFCSFPVKTFNKTRVSNVIDYSLTRNYVQLRVIIFISCNFAGLRVIGEIFISRNFYNVISRNSVMITRNKRNYNYA